MGRIKAIVFLMLMIFTVVSAVPVCASERPKDKDLSIYSGSGFFITSNVVVTCKHVVSGASKIEIVYNNDTVRSAVVIGSDEDSDLALLRVSGLEERVTPLIMGNSGIVRQGSRVYAIGFPLPMVMGTQVKLSEGLISSTAGIQGDWRMFQISAPVQPGNSGGPLLNDRAEVVGVVTGGLNAASMLKMGIIPQNVNYAVKISAIHNMINSFRVDAKVTDEPSGVSMNAVDVMDIARKAVVLVVVIK